MGFLDDIQGAVNRGTASMGRAGRSTQIKMQKDSLIKQRQQYAAQLGASLYEETRNLSEFRSGREALYDGIAQIDDQCAALDAELESLANAQAQQQALKCPKCGSNLSAGDLFCMGCGTPMAEIQQMLAASTGATTGAVAAAPAHYDGPTCPNCGAPIEEDDVFCMKCGANLAELKAAEAEEPPTQEAEAAPEVPAPVEQIEEVVEEQVEETEPAPVVSTQVEEIEDPVEESAEEVAAVAAPAATAPAAAPEPEPEPVAISEPEPKPEPEPEPAPEPETRTCPHCGAEISPNHKFCLMCGKPIEN